ncbi:MAG: DUF1269 domain-containing protein [Ilumatobacter sp.]
MSDLVVFTYKGEIGASAALAHVVTQKQENIQKPLLAIEDAAVAVKTPKHKVKINQTMENAVKGSRTAGAGLWGLLIGLLFGGPLLVAAVAMGISSLLGRKIDLGIDNDFIDSVSNGLEPGDSALFLLVNGATADQVAEALGDHQGTLYHTTLSDEAAASLAEASTNEELAGAIESENADD